MKIHSRNIIINTRKMASVDHRWRVFGVLLLFLSENRLVVTGARLTRQTSSSKQNQGKKN